MPSGIDLTPINDLINKGEMKDAFAQILNLDQNNLDVKILKSKLFIQNGDYNQALELSEVALRESLEESHPFRIFKSSVVKADSLWRLGRVEESLNLLSDNSLEKDFTEEDGNSEVHQSWLSQYYLILGNVYHDLGDLNASLIAYDQCLVIREIIGIGRDLSVVVNNIGNIYTQKGELTRAFEYYLRGFDISVRINNELETAFVLGNLGIISEMQGNYSLAIDFLERAHKIFKQVDHKYGIAHCLDYIGKLYFQIGKNGDSKKILELGLEVKKEINNDILTSYTLYYLILVSVDNHNIDSARKYFLDLKEIGKKQGNKRVLLFIDMCNAIILKYSNRLIDKAEAQKIFKAIIDQGYIEYEITIYATLHLCDLLMLELKQFSDIEILNELDHYVATLFKIAKSERLNSLLAETYLIKSKLALFLGEIENARSFLENALSIADENGYLRIAIQISNNFDRLLESSTKLENLISKQSTLRDRFDIAEVEDLFLNIVRKRTTEINLANETAVGFYVIDTENNPVYLKEFTPTDLVDQVIEWVISLKRSRLQNNSQELPLDRLKYRQYTAIIKFESGITFCYIFEGQSYSAKQKLESIINAFKLDITIWTAIKGPKEEISGETTYSIDEIVFELFNKEETDRIQEITVVHQPKNLPDNMVAFKDYLHPVRLWILKVLSSSYRISRSELSQILSVNSGTLTRHLEVFTSNDLLRQEKEFVDDKPRIIYYLEPKGTQLYNEIKRSLLETFV